MPVRAVEWKKEPYTWGKAIEITEDKVINLRLREENNLIIYDEWDNEIYTDLQLPNEVRPTDTFPVWVTTGRAVVDNWWDVSGTVLIAKTTSWDYIMILYGDNGKFYIDNGTWSLKELVLKSELQTMLEWYMKIWENRVLDNEKEVLLGYAYEDQWDLVSNQHIILDPKWSIKVYNAHGTYINEITIDDGAINIEKKLHNDTHKQVNVDFEKISVEDTDAQESHTYPLFWQNRIATLDDVNEARVTIDTSAPSNPVEWKLWLDMANYEFKIYDGTGWLVIAQIQPPV